MRARKKSRPRAPPVAAAELKPSPVWLRSVILGLSGLLALAWVAREAGDSDMWWHLKTGQFILREHRPPVPDPFAWTTYLGRPMYAGEEVTRYFNLTHEWLSQIAMYAAYAAGGSTGLVIMRSMALGTFCALAGLMAWRRTGEFYRAAAAMLATAVVAHSFTADRPQYFTYVFLAITINLLDARRWSWLLPPLFLLWANCHGGFLLGWVVVGIYFVESLYLRWRGRPAPGERWLWAMGMLAVIVSGVNPNGYRVFEVLLNYQKSAVQSQILEWYRPRFWELSPFTVLVYGALVAIIVNRRNTRPADWLLVAVFGAAAFAAFRNVILAAWTSAYLIASYMPWWRGFAGFRAKMATEFAAAALLMVAIGALIVRGPVARFRDPVNMPVAGAANFLDEHRVKGRLFNTYGEGGYLIWRLWPRMQVFTDGRALNERVSADAQRILFAAGDTGGKSYDDLLNSYGAEIIVMSAFDPISGAAYYLPAALADPHQTEWKLVYHDAHEIIYLRNPPGDVRALDPLEGLVAMEDECSFLVNAGAPNCARGMADVFERIGDRERVSKWMEIGRAAGLR